MAELLHRSFGLPANVTVCLTSVRKKNSVKHKPKITKRRTKKKKKKKTSIKEKYKKGKIQIKKYFV